MEICKSYLIVLEFWLLPWVGSPLVRVDGVVLHVVVFTLAAWSRQMCVVASGHPRCRASYQENTCVGH